MIVYVQFEDSTETKIIGVYGCPQPETTPNQGEIEDTDPRYLAWLNPPPDYLAINSAILQGLKHLAEQQKAAITNRIGTLNDAIELELATPEEEAELPSRVLQLKQWKTYAILLGRVTTQAGWPVTVAWPLQPANGMDLTVSAASPDAA
jgi:hypothetical protein